MLEKISENNIEANNVEEKFSIDDLISFIGESEMELDKLEDERGFSLELDREMDLKLMEKLKERKEKFKNVFETENGSVYFVIQGGKSLRFKKEKEGEGECFKRQPILDNIFFVDDVARDTFLKIIKSGNGDNLLDIEIEVSDFSIGRTPVEIGIMGRGEVVLDEYEKDGKKYLKVIGTKYKGIEEMYKSFSSGAHIGHKITKKL
jgi:hypothetical protein